MNDHHMHDNSWRGQHPIPRTAINSCPTSIGTYVALHLDSVSKILNHILFLTVIVDVFLFLSSFSVSYLPNHMGFNTVLCSFLLAAVSVLVLLIVNNSRISALSVLAPTEFMVGVATGGTIGAAVLAGLLSSTYKTVTHCKELAADGGAAAGKNNTHYDPVFTTACSNTGSMTGIWFWAGLAAWLNVVAAMLLVTGRHELSEHYQQYETIGGIHGDDAGFSGGSNPQPQHHDFEETFRRQQQEILGASQAAAMQNRAASMFVGDYSSIPEVRDTSTSMSTVTLNSQQQQGNNGGQNKEAQILSV